MDALRPADKETVRTNLRTEDGFGMIELLIAIVMLNVGILAIVAAFNSSVLGMRRATQTATAVTLAEKQMELYRGLLYANIVLDTTSTNLAATPSTNTYATDQALDGIAPHGSPPQLTTAIACTASPIGCQPTQTFVSAGVSYRIDTYIVNYTPASGRLLKLVTVVVRDTTSLKTLARLTSTFDAATG